MNGGYIQNLETVFKAKHDTRRNTTQKDFVTKPSHTD